jgi:hypothetical protein
MSTDSNCLLLKPLFLFVASQARCGIAVTALTSARPELQLLKPLSDHTTALCRAPVTEPVVFYGVSTEEEDEQEGDLPFDGFPGFYALKNAYIGFTLAGGWAYLYSYRIKLSRTYYKAMRLVPEHLHSALRLPKEAFMQGFGYINELVCGAQNCYIHDTFSMRDSMKRLRDVKDNPLGATLVHMQHGGAHLVMVPPVDTEQEITAVRAAHAEHLEPLEQDVVNCLHEQCGSCWRCAAEGSEQYMLLFEQHVAHLALLWQQHLEGSCGCAPPAQPNYAQQWVF